MGHSDRCASTHALTSLSPPSLSHFHLDHCGALPYFTEMVGYDGPLYMTQPTKAICPILLVCVCVCVCVRVSHNTRCQVCLIIASPLLRIYCYCCYLQFLIQQQVTPTSLPLPSSLLPSPSSLLPAPSSLLPSPSSPCYCQYMQEDYRKITVEKKGETNFFTSQMIKDCMKKVTAVSLHQTVKVGRLPLDNHQLHSPWPSLYPLPPLPPPPQVDDELEIKAYYAGHVLGAAMFLVRVGTQSFVYTVSGRQRDFPFLLVPL